MAAGGALRRRQRRRRLDPHSRGLLRAGRPQAHPRGRLVSPGGPAAAAGAAVDRGRRRGRCATVPLFYRSPNGWSATTGWSPPWDTRCRPSGTWRVRCQSACASVLRREPDRAPSREVADGYGRTALAPADAATTPRLSTSPDQQFGRDFCATGAASPSRSAGGARLHGDGFDVRRWPSSPTVWRISSPVAPMTPASIWRLRQFFGAGYSEAFEHFDVPLQLLRRRRPRRGSASWPGTSGDHIAVAPASRPTLRSRTYRRPGDIDAGGVWTLTGFHRRAAGGLPGAERMLPAWPMRSPRRRRHRAPRPTCLSRAGTPHNAAEPVV